VRRPVSEHACRMGLEGIVSKRLSAPYQSGPTRGWLKESGQSCHDRGARGRVGSAAAPELVIRLMAP
jgi:bifunctional non-homologous end joining protein LigD